MKHWREFIWRFSKELMDKSILADFILVFGHRCLITMSNTCLTISGHGEVCDGQMCSWLTFP